MNALGLFRWKVSSGGRGVEGRVFVEMNHETATRLAEIIESHEDRREQKAWEPELQGLAADLRVVAP